MDITPGAVDTPALTFVPKAYSLDLGRPNPFREMTTIPFAIPREGMTTLSVWDVTGRLVKNLVQRDLAAGYYNPTWDGRDQAGRLVAAGIYFVRLESGSFNATRKVIRLR